MQESSGKSSGVAILPGVKSLEQIQYEIEKELDRTFFCDYIKKAMVERERERTSALVLSKDAIKDGGSKNLD